MIVYTRIQIDSEIEIYNQDMNYKKELITIGKMARLSRLSVSALRYYDEIDLVKPVYINPENNYRYYVPAQLYDINFISSWQELGFSLTEIRKIKDNNDLSVLIELYVQKERAIQKKIDYYKKIQRHLIDNKNSLKKYTRKTDIESLGDEGFSGIELRVIPEEKVVFVQSNARYDYVSYQESINRILKMVNENDLQTKALSHLKTIFYNYPDPDFLGDNMEYCLSLTELPAKTYDFIRTIPEMSAVVYFYFGPVRFIQEYYNRMEEFIHHQGYKPAGSTTWVYTVGTPITNNEKRFITQLQIPVSKK